MSQTERGLTSEFGMGSGGSHALWPVTQLTATALLFKHIGGIYILEFYNPDVGAGIGVTVDVPPHLVKLLNR